MDRDELVERVAEALWQEEFLRGAGRFRLVPWAEAGESAYKQWRPLARAALAIIEPAVREEETQRCLAAFSEGWAMPLTSTGIEAITLIRNTIRAGAKP